MFTSTRSATLVACLLALAPLASQATAINLDFESLATSTQVGNAYASAGVSIINGSLSVQNTASFSFKNTLPGSMKFGLTTGGFTLDVLDPSVTQFDIISFAYFGGPFKATVYDEAGNTFVIPIDSFSGYDLWVTSTEYKLDKAAFGLIDRFVFEGVDIGIDNIRLSLQDTNTSPNNPVPEPAGYALAGLALLGVGLATRRRRV